MVTFHSLKKNRTAGGRNARVVELRRGRGDRSVRLDRGTLVGSLEWSLVWSFAHVESLRKLWFGIGFIHFGAPNVRGILIMASEWWPAVGFEKETLFDVRFYGELFDSGLPHHLHHLILISVVGDFLIFSADIPHVGCLNPRFRWKFVAEVSISAVQLPSKRFSPGRLKWMIYNHHKTTKRPGYALWACTSYLNHGYLMCINM